MIIRFVFIYLLGFINLAQAQQKFTISGYVKDASTGEDLIGASIWESKSKIGTNTNAYGYFVLEIPASKDSLLLKASYSGYTDWSQSVYLDKNLQINVLMSVDKSSEQIQEIEIIAEDKFRDAIEKPQMSVEKLEYREIKTVPVIFGETDLIKVLQLKPGVKSGSEASAGLYVRGGGPDQNLVLLDEATVYNASHLFGFFSIFNSDAIKNVELYKGDFPAQYGGRLSSVLDIKMKEGNKNKFSGTGGIGLISSRLTLEGPIQKGKSSFIISGRRTYFDLITKQINKANADKKDYNPIPDYYFYDLNLKANYEFSQKDRLFVSGYFGRDVFNFESNTGRFNFDFDWGNTTATVRWNHVFSPKLFLNTTAIYSDYQYKIRNSFASFIFNIGSAIKDYNFKTDFDYLHSEKHHFRFGTQFTQHYFEVARISLKSDDNRVDFNSGNGYESSEMGVYLNDDIKISELWRLNAGLRASGFLSYGKLYTGLEPRTAVRYKVSDKTSIKASFSQMYQYVHLLSNSGATLPTDIWYPSNDVVKPQLSTQIAGGVSHLFRGGDFLFSAETYYKTMQNQLDFKDGAQIFANDNLDGEFVFGKGWGYGLELYVEKKSGKLTGWLGYTLSWTKRQFADSTNGNAPINFGEAFYPRYDRRHDVALVIMYNPNPKWTFAFNWVFGNNSWLTLQEGRFGVQGINGTNFSLGNDFGYRNNYQMPAYHRADFSIIRKFKPKWGESDLTFSVYNLYSRRNAFTIYYETTDDQDPTFASEYKARQLALFPIIPTLTYNFKF
ncbi:MAG: TonB-dependent receptor [Thermonemataceae bacterium]|nr:TonB-dependent receptor [Thermonemataceae bacterium]